MKNVLQSYLTAFATSHAFQAHNVSLWLHYCKLRKRLFLNQQDSQQATSQLLSSESCNQICRSYWQHWFVRKFFTRRYYYPFSPACATFLAELCNPI